MDSLGNGAITTVWKWLNDVNAASFAGHSDWRLPSENGCNSCHTFDPTYNCPCAPSELETILQAPYPCGFPSPCIASIFGPTASYNYWSASTIGTTYPTTRRDLAWVVTFIGGSGSVGDNTKASGDYVRAVR